jgi:hypothetical protein
MLQFSDLSDLGQDGTGQSLIFENVILWDFDILPFPPSQTLHPRDPDTVNEELDSVLSPINLQGQTGCDCDLQQINLQGQTGCNCDLQPINPPRILLYSTASLIVKSGPWDRDDPRNNYNCDIDY